MFDCLLWWFTGFRPYREISEAGRPYLDRYYLCSIGKWRVYIHCFVGSDPDRGLHDHPWRKAYSLILCGWYWEITSYDVRKIRWFNALTGDSRHRVVLPAGVKRCWTLFIHTAPDEKPWGFFRPVGKDLDPQFEGVLLFTPWKKFTPGTPETKWWEVNGRRGEPKW